jgi:hypothetical protein
LKRWAAVGMRSSVENPRSHPIDEPGGRRFNLKPTT